MDYRLPWIMGNMQGTYNMTTDVRKTWTPENPNAKYPIYVWADQLGKGNYRNSTLFTYKGDYLSLRQVSLSYSLPKSLINKAFIETIGSFDNRSEFGLYYSGKNNIYSGTRWNSRCYIYLTRTVTFGLNITF
jgi:hypothetical protein